MKQVVLPERINKITLDFNKREFFVDGIFIGKGVYFFDICFDNGDWKISINNNIKEYVNPPKKGLTEKGANYCCIGDIEETDEYFPKFEPLPLLYFTEDKGSKSKK